MKLLKLRFAFVCVFLLAPLATAIADKATGPPQLIDRDVIFGNPEIAAAQLSPDGKYVAFLKPWKDADPDIPILREAKAEYAKLQ